MTSRLVDLCEEAARFTNFHDWQARMYADALVALVIHRYNEEIAKEEPLKEAFASQLEMLEKAEQLIKEVKQDFWVKSSLQECQQLIEIIKARLARFE